jgi:nitrile hydratase accessory protein
MNAPEPVFEAPWHAHLFALTVHLNESGLFDWPFWADRFGATLARHGLRRELNGGEDYFAAWLDTLERFLSEKGMAKPYFALLTIGPSTIQRSVATGITVRVDS